MRYIEKTLALNGYPKEFVRAESRKTLHNMIQINENKATNQAEKDNLQKMYIPYEKGTSEKIKRIAGKHRIDDVFIKVRV